MARPDSSPQVLGTLCAAAGFPLTKEQSSQLAIYLDLLMRWNRMMNLVGARHWRDALDDLILDSFHLAAFLREHILPTLPPSPVTWDLGAGAGLPGIPLRMVWHDGTYCMVESRDKRTIFLSTVLARCPLKGTQVFRGRAEQFMEGKKGRSHRKPRLHAVEGHACLCPRSSDKRRLRRFSHQRRVAARG